MKPYLTTAALDYEYAHWGDQNRNSGDLRFGQYIMNVYQYDGQTDVFNTEDKATAYRIIREELALVQR